MWVNPQEAPKSKDIEPIAKDEANEEARKRLKAEATERKRIHEEKAAK